MNVIVALVGLLGLVLVLVGRRDKDRAPTAPAVVLGLGIGLLSFAVAHFTAALW